MKKQLIMWFLKDRKKFRTSIRGVLLTSALALPVLCPSGIFAQESSPESKTIVLDPIVLTGERIDRTLRRTATSVSLIGGEELDKSPDVTSVAEAVEGTPNLLYTGVTDAPIIRGTDTKGPIVAGNAYLSKPIPRGTISIDGRYVTSGELALGGAPVWDVSSIEVYRGPQTTTQGANSIAGAVVVNTNDPIFTHEFTGQLVYSSHSGKRLSFTGSGPLSKDLAARLAVDYGGRDTYVTYTNPAFPDHDKDFSFQDLNARFKLLWLPADIPGLEAKLTYSHTRLNSPANERVTEPFDDLNNAAAYMDVVETQADTGVLDVRYEFENGVTLNNQLQYTDAGYDFEFTELFPGNARRNTQTTANEFRLNFGDDEAALSGVAGLYYSSEKAHNVLDNLLGTADANIRQDSAAAFSEATWRFADRWALTGGLRYQNDRIRHDGTTSYVPDVNYSYDETFTAFLPKLSLSYDISDGVTVGGLVSKGYLPGGTGVNFSGGTYYTFDEETAWNYELFARAGLLDDRLHINGNLFYTEYEGLQRSVADYLPDGTPFGSIIVNGDKAEAYGLEVNADYQASDNLQFRGGLGLLRTEINKFSDYRGNDFEGREFEKAPGYMLSLGAEWDVTPKLRLSGDVRLTDGYYSSDTNAPETEVDSYSVANFRLSYRPTDKHEVFAYVNNVMDERAPLQQSFDRAGNLSATILEPRELGAGVKIQF